MHVWVHLTFRCIPPWAVYCQARRWYTKLAEAVRTAQAFPRAANQVRECGAPFCIDGSLCYFQVHTAVGGILPGEEIVHEISRGGANSANISPSGKPSTGICSVLQALRRRGRSNVSHTDTVGILPGEEIIHAISRVSVISTNCIPSGNTHIRALLCFAYLKIQSFVMQGLDARCVR